MDLQVYAMILIVFLVSFLSYLFISKFLPHGKTFDEMIAEKKRLREEVLGTVKPASKDKSNSAGNKKKPKKEVKKREQPKVVTSNESDASESSEPVVAIPEPVVLKKNPPKPQQQQQNQPKKGKKGILVNKNEPVAVKEPVAVEEQVNHFEEIHPKDAVELQVEKKQVKKSKPKTETPPISPKNQPVKVVENKKRRNEPSTSAVDQVTDEQEITDLMRELSRADLTKKQIQLLIDFLLNKQSDTIGHDPTEWTEGKSDLVQKLKKQLQDKETQLKNEQDALSGMQQKLKELRNEYNAEKIQANANLKAHAELLQNSKLDVKNLQTEIAFLNEKHNNEKQTMSASFKQLQTQYLQVKEQLKAQEDVPNVKQLETDNQTLQKEISEKTQQIQKLQKFIDEQKIVDEQAQQKLLESDNRIAESDVLMRKKEERCAIMEAELRTRAQEVATLTAEVVRVKELEKTVKQQNVDVEQLKKQLSEEQQQNNHADESKIEIRNLQNALDSSKKELEAQQKLAGDFKSKVDDLTRQLSESKQLTNSKSSSGDSFLMNEKMNELIANHQNVIGQKDKQLADYQKQVENLQKAENELTKQIEEQKAKNNTQPRGVVDVTKVKDLFTKHFPDTLPTSSDGDDTKWLESALEKLKMQIVSNKSSLNNTSPIANNNVTNNNHLNNNSVNNSNAMNGDSNSSTSAAENELVLLQNAQLKSTVEEYKNIIAETETMLKNLESKVREQDAYWTKVVLMKDSEIENLKSVTEKS